MAELNACSIALPGLSFREVSSLPLMSLSLRSENIAVVIGYYPRGPYTHFRENTRRKRRPLLGVMAASIRERAGQAPTAVSARSIRCASRGEFTRCVTGSALACFSCELSKRLPICQQSLALSAWTEQGRESRALTNEGFDMLSSTHTAELEEREKALCSVG
ncbi:hypothetical protein Nepgr_033966 [Nepenthes gracilis]|uniref:Uncharacterized protein n=1 Tax=Nepenthes gracilis TaxID=150966 RepID=A0AAD3TME1_NEPGR|nr:hypothetical protein Nepgr_033966 [Nepenthes gracilis]